MSYGHAERNLALIRQLEAETLQLLGSLDQLHPEQSAWLQEVSNRGSIARRGITEPTADGVPMISAFHGPAPLDGL